MKEKLTKTKAEELAEKVYPSPDKLDYFNTDSEYTKVRHLREGFVKGILYEQLKTKEHEKTRAETSNCRSVC